MRRQSREDERHVELSTIAAIFPELSHNPVDPFSATLEIPVAPSQPFCFRFKPLPVLSLALSKQPNLPNQQISDHENARGVIDETAEIKLDLHEVKYLPPISLKISLPDGYPHTKSPSFSLSTNPPWVPRGILERLESHSNSLWEDYGRGPTIFTYIDYLKQVVESRFGYNDDPMELCYDLKLPLLAFDQQIRRKLFEETTFHCSVCLEPKKGYACYQLRHCGHVFCIQCLQDFYTKIITEGNVDKVRCMNPSCVKDSTRISKKQRSVHPSELLEISLSQATVQRYMDLKIKKRLESDKSTVYCPREWCQGPARTKKHKISNDMSSFPDSDSEVDDGGPALEIKHTSDLQITPNSTLDRLAICSICGLAFCRICSRSWHGELVRNCLPRDAKDITKEEQASYEYIQKNTSPCPTCNCPVQKITGCNHMTCFQCRTHFCYLCGSWLDQLNPYQHFNNRRIPCYQRLWETNEGDKDGGIGVNGGLDNL